MPESERERVSPREPSAAPLEVDVAPQRRRQRFMGALGVALLASSLVVPAVLVVIVRGVTRGHAPEAPSPSVFPLPRLVAVRPLRTPAPAPALRDAVPVPSQKPANGAGNGVIYFARAGAHHRVFVDGTSVRATSAIVPCGAHTIQVGSAGAPRTIDVPCAGKVVLDR